MFKVSQMLLTVKRSIEIINILDEKYNLNFKKDIKMIVIVQHMIKYSTLSNDEIAKEIYEECEWQSGQPAIV